MLGLALDVVEAGEQLERALGKGAADVAGSQLVELAPCMRQVRPWSRQHSSPACTHVVIADQRTSPAAAAVSSATPRKRRPLCPARLTAKSLAPPGSDSLRRTWLALQPLEHRHFVRHLPM